MNLDADLLKDYAKSIADEVALRFSKKVSLDDDEYKALVKLIDTEIEFAFSGLIEKQPQSK